MTTVRYLFLIMLCLSLQGAEQTIAIESEQKPQKTPLLIGLVDAAHQIMDLLGNNLIHYLAFSGQFDVRSAHIPLPKTQHELEKYYNDGYSLVLFVNSEHDAYVWRLYDTYRRAMIKGGKLVAGDPIKAARCIAEQAWPIMTGRQAMFSSPIAFVRRRGARTELCLTDGDGKNTRVIMQSAAICIAPCWNNDAHSPFILFSQFTARNVRVVATDMHGKRWTVLDDEGTCVGVAYPPKGTDVIYCRNGEIWAVTHDAAAHTAQHHVIVQEKEPCSTPCLLANGDIIYCCKGAICQHVRARGISKRVTSEGYCVGPTVHRDGAMLAYSRRVGQWMQLYIGDLRSNEHKQITFGKGNKIDASWSPCGCYLAYCYQEGKNSKIGIVNIFSGVQQIITSDEYSASYPSWAPWPVS